ncbi:MAG: LolA family protein [Eubacteriales bacterium]
MKKLLCLICILCVLILPACKSESKEDIMEDENITQNETETNTDENGEQDEDELDLDEIIDQESIVKLLQKGAETNEVSYQLTYISGEASMDSQYWQKGDLIKIVSDSPEGTVITIYDNDEVITYYPDEKTGFRYIQDYDNEFTSDYINVGDQYFDGVSYTFIENSSFHGEKCIVVTMIDSYDNENKLWISTQYGIVIKFEGFDEGGEFTSEVKDIKIGGIPDSTFDIPTDIIFEDE